MRRPNPEARSSRSEATLQRISSAIGIALLRIPILRSQVAFPAMELERLVAALAPEAVLGSPDPVEVRDLAYDARAVTPGAAFFAFPGARGRARLRRARRSRTAPPSSSSSAPSSRRCRSSSSRRARARWRPRRTSSSASRRASSRSPASPARVGRRRPPSCSTPCSTRRAAVAGLLGTVESRVGGEVRPVVRTTPEAIDLQRTFREMLDAGNRSVALEASSHASALHRLDRVRFDALVFTNLSQDHLDFHPSMEDYFAAKRKLFTGAHRRRPRSTSATPGAGSSRRSSPSHAARR